MSPGTIRRTGTTSPTTQTALATGWAEARLDPNGYYSHLGLRPDRAWTMGEIRAAFLRSARARHPDSGGDGDARGMERVVQSYSVLSDPESRRRYDALGPGEQWTDDPEVILRLKQRIRQAAVEAGLDAQEVWEMAAASIRRQAEAEAPAPRRRRGLRAIVAGLAAPRDPDRFRIAVYGYEGDPAEPSEERLLGWLGAFAVADRAVGAPRRIRLGFWSGPSPHVASLAGLPVMFVPAALEPDVGAALYLLLESDARCLAADPAAV